MKREVTIVYTVEDEATWRAAGNPLRYEHHGLKSHTVSIGDCIEAHDHLETALQEIANMGFGDSKESTRAQAALDADYARIKAALA